MNKKGFSLIGVMVASVIGLIVVAGMNQLFINMSSQVKQIDTKSKQTIFQDQLWDALKGSCTHTVKNALPNMDQKIFEGKSIDSANTDTNYKKFHKIWNKDSGDPFIDLSSTTNLPINKNTVESLYNIAKEGALHFTLSCREPGSGAPCRCQTSFPCQKSWILKLITHSKVHGVLKYNKPISFNITTVFNRAWNQSPPNPTDPETFSCNVGSAVGSSGVPPNQTCPAGELLKGFDTNGGLICESLKDHLGTIFENHIQVSEYSANLNCLNCQTEKNIGKHLFCAFSGLGSSSTGNDSCRLRKKSDQKWYMLTQHSGSGGRQCRAVCFNLKDRSVPTLNRTHHFSPP